jgi:hypothetical protein
MQSEALALESSKSETTKSTMNKQNFEYLGEFYNLSKIIYKLGFNAVDMDWLS